MEAGVASLRAEAAGAVFDVIIVGAGPAGCLTAYELSKTQAPRSILVLEASPTLQRMKPCGGSVPGSLVEGVPELARFVAGSTSRQLRFYDGDLLRDIRYDAPRLYFTRGGGENCLDAVFPRILSERGVEVVTGRRVSSIDNRGEGYAVVASGGEKYLGRIVVDASGAVSPFNHRLCRGKEIGGSAKYVSSVIEFPLRGDDREAFQELIAWDAAANRIDLLSGDPVGFYWAFHYANLNRANIGAGFALANKQTFNTRKRLTRYLQSTGLRNWDANTIRTWVVPYEIQRELCSDHVLWVGDSAGMCNPLSGEGISIASFAAKAIAETCRESLAKHDYSTNALKAYANCEQVSAYITWSRRMTNYVKLAMPFGTRGPQWLIRQASGLRDRLDPYTLQKSQ